jgi:hypothetical protein
MFLAASASDPRGEKNMINLRLLVVLLFLSSSALLTTTLVFAVFWVRAREQAIRAALDRSRQLEETSPDIQHLVHAVDSIAVEVERISEGQRFTTQLLSERGQGAPQQKRAALPERVITPH